MCIYVVSNWFYNYANESAVNKCIKSIAVVTNFDLHFKERNFAVVSYHKLSAF